MEPHMRTFILGHFGSGKTEVAIHIAISLTTRPKRPLLLDLDFITPYYRCRDVVRSLAVEGVDVVAPDGSLACSDLPVVTGRAMQAVHSYDGPVVADIGGDEGARVVGSLAGLASVESAAASLGLPVCFSAATASVAAGVETPILPLRLRMTPPWAEA